MSFWGEAKNKEGNKKRGFSFFELARKHIVKSKNPRNRTLSQDIDKILYGAN
ncbi:MAG: hypothetical protein G01um101417_412 [Parcubacteria group bacterium Gr01-1014_17]|nr:MAG: hypothetical protein G01um101417_412 [Parcubacteria group bacterium Gr01-1014_17]